MPFRSKAQQRFMFAKHPQMAEEFAKATPDIKALPEHVKKMSDGGEVFNPPQGDWEAIKAQLMKGQSSSPIDPLEQTGETDPGHIKGITDSLASGMALGSMAGLPSAMKGLGEAGEISIGRMAPKMEEMPSKIEVFSKGVMGKGTPNEMTIWGVKGAPEDVAKLGYGNDPASIPEHVLKQHGLLPDTSIDASNIPSPNEYAHGGEVMGYSDGGIVEALRHLISGDKTEASKADQIDPVVTNSVSTSSDTAKGYADGGEIDPVAMMQQAAPMAAQDVNQTNPATMGLMPSPMIPPMGPPPAGTLPSPGPQYMDNPSPNLSQVNQNIQQMPPTNPSIYQGISADDRANLMKSLLAQKASPGNLAVSGIAGLGDAISNSFGKGSQHTQQDIRGAQAQNVQNQIGIMDTQRQQKMQDVQASIAQQEADPNSPISQGMRAFLKAQGMKVPSGMSGGMLKQVLPDVTKIFDAHMQAATAGNAQAIDAAKSVMGESLWQQIKESVGISEAPAKGEEYLSSRLPGGNTSNGGWSVKR